MQKQFCILVLQQWVNSEDRGYIYVFLMQQHFFWYEIQVNADVIKISLLYLLNIYIFKSYHEIMKNYTISAIAGNIPYISYFSK